MSDRPTPKKKKPQRRYHPVDSEPDAFEVGDNPDWLVGAY